MRTIVYLDVFNLYFGCLKGTPHRWLNLERLARLLLSANNDITRIKYFTARVSARPNDLDQPNRQQLSHLVADGREASSRTVGVTRLLLPGS